ncbi:endoglucanase-like protein precursor [Massarina eburnea CBS 473.64]|uniref:cellulase n=1 Tax=Massarina eburnea CBS 473.64 TaxID=1395130 RepID=A0A6A6S547_9PLEO|nr:endoglucanase-like protein precursor [Massarina eburnea CBS 473.64]
MLFSKLMVAASLASTSFAQTRKLKWFGINESGAEFGETNFTGAYNKEYIWYDLDTIDQFIDQGVNLFRLNFLMERLTPDKLTASFDKLYLGNLTEQVNHITDKGAYAVLNPHNYGRFYSEVITDTDGFKTWWKNVATEYKENELVVFDTNNEYHDMDQTLVFNLNQAAIDGVREAGATTQYITAEGNSYTGAWTWVSSGNADSLVSLSDPQDKLVYQMHQYLDTDGSGTNEACVNATILSDRLAAATQWLKDNKKQGFLGEFAAGTNDQCISALEDGLKYLGDNADVWYGAAWWAAGPWWGDYMYSMEPTSGPAWTTILPKIKSYFYA